LNYKMFVEIKKEKEKEKEEEWRSAQNWSE
jgi:hypothetical protein